MGGLSAEQPGSGRRAMIAAWISRVEAGEDLGQAEMSAAIDQIMRGNWSDEQLSALLL
ncbi:MAG TPA: hypothetical protein VIK18_04035, partial [Pirellulales bacterium]